MKLFQFFFLILKKGSLRHTSFNFEEERKEILHQLPNQSNAKTPGLFQKLKWKVLQSEVGYSIVANLGYLLHARKMNVMLFVCSKKKLVYCRILKSASTSMLKELLPFIDPMLEVHSLSDEVVDALAFRYLKKKLSRDEEQYPKFAFVRNPFHRIVSVYLDLFDPSANHFSYDSYWFGILKSNMTFSEFINTISKVPDFLKGPHFSPQHYMLTNVSKLNTISCFRIDKDQERLKDFLLQYKITLPYQNKQTKLYDYKSFYNSDLLYKVYEMYNQDVIAFGYEDEYHQLLNFVSN